MRKSAAWMVIWDDRILMYLSKHGPDAPLPISKHRLIHTGRSNISIRLNLLTEHNLTSEIANGVYEITELGEEYLSGDYNAETGERLTDGERA